MSNNKKRDFYSKAIEYFRKNPEKIYTGWNSISWNKYSYSKLFQRVGSEESDGENECGKYYGCPAMIKFGVQYVAGTKRLTKLCKEANLPNMNKYSEYSFTKKKGEELIPYLKEFAKIQRIADKELGRAVPGCS